MFEVRIEKVKGIVEPSELNFIKEKLAEAKGKTDEHIELMKQVYPDIEFETTPQAYLTKVKEEFEKLTKYQYYTRVKYWSAEYWIQIETRNAIIETNKLKA